MPYLTPLDTRDMGNGQALLLNDFTYRTRDNKQAITALAGFVTDFASIPRAFRRLITGNDNTKKPSVIHDWDYRRKDCPRTRKRVDQIFLMGMKENGVPGWKRYTAYYGVRVGGWASWQTE